MFISFDQMPETSRVWVYQSNRPFTENEANTMLTDAATFLDSWTVHNQTLNASSQIFYNQFLVLAVNEAHNAASGCSIDKSVHFVQALENKYNIRLFDRTLQAFFIDAQVRLLALKEIKPAVEAGQITPQTLAFNNLVGTIDQLNNQWLQPAEKTWLVRYFKAKDVAV